MKSQERFLITGSSGFVGSYLLRKIIEKNLGEVHILLRSTSKCWRIQDLLSKCHVHQVDLMNKEELKKVVKKINPTIIYHLAAYGAYPFQTEAQPILETNLMGTWNLLEATKDIPYKLFINTGSSSEYGFKSKPMKETDILEPASYYAVSKAATTQLCAYFAKSEHKPVVTFRLFSVYGPYEEPSRLIPTLMMALRNKTPMQLVSPKTSRDMIYIDDVVHAYLSVAKLSKLCGDAINIGTGKQSTIKQIVQESQKASKKKTEFRWGTMDQRIWDTNIWVADSTKLQKVLHWKPQTTLLKGLTLTWKWFETHAQFYEKGK